MKSGCIGNQHSSSSARLVIVKLVPILIGQGGPSKPLGERKLIFIELNLSCKESISLLNCQDIFTES